MLGFCSHCIQVVSRGRFAVRHRVAQVAVAALVLLAASIAAQTAASAADPTPHGGGTLIGRDVKGADVNSKGSDVNAKALVSECDIFGSPDPQFSASNSTFHWGLRAE